MLLKIGGKLLNIEERGKEWVKKSIRGK